MSQGVMLLVSIFCIILGVLWLILPFAVFGIKGRIDQQIFLTKKLLEELQALRSTTTSQSK